MSWCAVICVLKVVPMQGAAGVLYETFLQSMGYSMFFCFGENIDRDRNSCLFTIGSRIGFFFVANPALILNPLSPKNKAPLSSML